jgi:hypothetical protein
VAHTFALLVFICVVLSLCEPHDASLAVFFNLVPTLDLTRRYSPHLHCHPPNSGLSVHAGLKVVKVKCTLE